MAASDRQWPHLMKKEDNLLSGSLASNSKKDAMSGEMLPDIESWRRDHDLKNQRQNWLRNAVNANSESD